MPVALGCLSLLFPRAVLALVWLFRDGYLSAAYGHWGWPLLGFFCVPLTTLAFAFASNDLGAPGAVPPFGWLLVGIGLLSDIGLLRRQSKSRRRR